MLQASSSDNVLSDTVLPELAVYGSPSFFELYFFIDMIMKEKEHGPVLNKLRRIFYGGKSCLEGSY